MQAHPEATTALTRWYMVAHRARWNSLRECQAIFATVDQVGRCLIFDIMGGNYRLIVVVAWRGQRFYLKELLTHREYERNLWHKWAF